MLETTTFCSLIEMQPIADKQTRAQSIQGRMSMGKVRFPERAPWWPAARDQMLKFPYDAHDDFVDALAYIGLGLTLQVGAGAARTKEDDRTEENTFGWLKLQRDQAERAVKQGFAAEAGDGLVMSGIGGSGLSGRIAGDLGDCCCARAIRWC